MIMNRNRDPEIFGQPADLKQDNIITGLDMNAIRSHLNTLPRMMCARQCIARIAWGHSGRCPLGHEDVTVDDRV